MKPYDKLNGSWVKNGAASQVNPPGALLKERNDTKNMNFNAHLRLFERFYQGNNSSGLHIEGTGIGLNLCFVVLKILIIFLKYLKKDMVDPL